MKIFTIKLSDGSGRFINIRSGHYSFFPNSYAKKPILLGREAESSDFNAGAPKLIHRC